MIRKTYFAASKQLCNFQLLATTAEEKMNDLQPAHSRHLLQAETTVASCHPGKVIFNKNTGSASLLVTMLLCEY